MIEKCRKIKKLEEELRRKYIIYYYLFIDECKVEVCKKIFLGILDIGEKIVIYILNKRKNFFIFIDNRGKYVLKNKILEKDKDFIREYICFFLKIELYYCRKLI